MTLTQIISKRNLIFVSILTIISAFFHFYNLNWGAPFYFHPDERNIAISVTQLQFPQQMNPQFFAYGSLPIYLIYFTGLLKNSLLQADTAKVLFEDAILISRFYSAIFATLLVPFLFLIGKKIKNNAVGFLAAILAMSGTGFIQFAHFGTFEMWLTFFSVVLFWICLEKVSFKTLVAAAITLGILVAIKISSIIHFPLLLIPLLKKYSHKNKKSFRFLFPLFLRFLLDVLLVIFLAAAVYFATNPYVLLDTPSFKNSMDYETNLALGNLPVFYTGEFYNSIPVVFQFLRIYPFLLNPVITIVFVVAFIFLLLKLLKNKQHPFLLLLAFFSILFFSQAFLFAKWIRYIVPTIPFVYLIVALGLIEFLEINKKRFHLKYLLLLFIISLNILFGVSYFMTAFVAKDTRVAAREDTKHIFVPGAQVLSEVYDLGIVPFNELPVKIDLFNFYDLDNNSLESDITALNEKLRNTDYIILPSPRILKTRLINKYEFPNGNAFYLELINNNIGFQKIYETPCDIFCKITYLGDPLFRFEQTANVFDRPVVMIFKKQ